ncbi:hydroxyproline dehydrogenase-like [Dysidea avara]|uniref:hydroxyproline dehydrogenase-like n=1 Tax=Dysidea avara TaxID=196820 RepID=UPI003324CE2C
MNRILGRTILASSPTLLQQQRRIISKISRYTSNSALATTNSANGRKERVGLYPGVPTYDLIRGWILYNLFRSNYLVENSIKALKFTERVVGQSLTESLLKATVFGHFCGDASEDGLRQKAEALTQRQMGTMFGYNSELMEDDLATMSLEERRVANTAKWYKVYANYLKSIDYAAQYTKDKPPFVACKLTSMVDTDVLRRLTTLLNYSDEVFKSYSTTSTSNDHHILNRHISSPNMPFKSQRLRETVTKLADCRSKGSVDLVDWQNHFTVANLDQLQLLLDEALPGVKRPDPLTDQEQQQVELIMKRLNDIGEHAVAKDVRVLMDAEQTYYQPAIRSFMVHCMMKWYNKEKPVVYDTLQSYLKSSHQTMLLSHLSTKRNNCIYAVKLVRGAYMDEEKRLAIEHGCEDPIHSDKLATDGSFNRNADYLLSQDDIFVFLATHNNDSVQMTKEKIKEYNRSSQSGEVVFAQLMGMADYISSPLAYEGYLVYKLLTYGVVREVLPYLARRALENRGAMEGAQIERKLMGKEISQRLLGRSRR